MPYHIEKRGSQHCVVKDSTKESMGCHATEAKAERQLSALHVNEPEAREADPLHIDCAMGSSLL